MEGSVRNSLRAKQEKKALQALKAFNKELDGKMDEGLYFHIFETLSLICLGGAVSSIWLGLYYDILSGITVGGLFNLAAFATIYKMGDYTYAQASNLVLHFNSTFYPDKEQIIENYKNEYKQIKKDKKEHNIGTLEAINRKNQLMKKYSKELTK